MFTGVDEDTKFADLLGRVGEIPINEPVLDVKQMGEGLRLIDAKPFRLDTKTAKALLELPTFVGERNVRDSHVEYLQNAMERGTFLPELVQLATCTLDGKDYRINGQHTCWAVYNMGEKGQKKDYNVRMFRYLAKSHDALRRLYSSFDRNAPRTPFNVLKSYLAGADGFDKYHDNVVKLAAEGLAMWMWEKETKARYDMDDRVYMMQNEYRALVFKVMNILSSVNLVNTGRHIRRQAVAAAMYATCKVPQKDKPADEFWARVIDGLDLNSKHDPRYKLREFLMGIVLRGGRGGSRVQKGTIGSEYVYRACIYCWNAWRRDEEQKQLTVPASASRPKAV